MVKSIACRASSAALRRGRNSWTASPVILPTTSQEAQEPSRQEAMGAKATEGNLLKQRREALAQRQSSLRAEMDKQRTDLFARQFRERGTLREIHAAEHSGVAAARLETRPKGLTAFLTRITGIGSLVAGAQGKADSKREATKKQQTEPPPPRHDSELKEMDRHYLALHRLEVRENRR